MYFEHIVAVNDPGNPMVRQLSREELWAGLLRRARCVSEFVEALERDEELESGENFSERLWDYGRYQVRVRIEHCPGERVVYRTHPLPNDEGGTLTMQIEEPDEGHLFVRFVYSTPVPEGVIDGVDVAAYLKSAYRQCDTDMVRRLRSLVEAGEL